MSAAGRRPRGSRRCPRLRIGRVSLYEHHHGWWIYFRQGGQPVRRRIGTDCAAAERVAAEINSQVTSDSPTLLDFVPIRVGDLQLAFLRHHDEILRSAVATISRYRTATQHLVDFVTSLPREPLAHELRAADFVSFLRHREVAPNGHAHTARRLLRDKGVQFIVETCRSMLAFAARHPHLPPYAVNPFTALQIDPMRIDDAKPVFVFDATSEHQFLQAAVGWEFAVQFTLAKTGLRPGELCHLLVEEVDLKLGWLAVRNKPELGWSVKTRNERAVPLIPEVRTMLQQVIGTRTGGVVFRWPRFVPRSAACELSRTRLLPVLEQRIAVAQQEKQALDRAARQQFARQFWQELGALAPDQIRRSFLRVAARCGLPQATCPKSWRHTFATLLQDANVDPLLRQITLGHQPAGAHGALGMTSVYSHSRPDTQAREIGRALEMWPESLLLARQRATDSSQGGVS